MSDKKVRTGIREGQRQLLLLYKNYTRRSADARECQYPETYPHHIDTPKLKLAYDLRLSAEANIYDELADKLHKIFLLMMDPSDD